MNKMVLNLYKNVLDQVMVIEAHKKEISRQILITRDDQKRLKLIHRFLTYDLNKHELFERATVVAINNKEENVIENIQRFYSHCEEGEELIEKIRGEIRYIKSFLKVIEKAIKYPGFMTFSERRMVQEIRKYVLEKVRIYNTIHL
ncbi:MAG: hypothetical protein H5T98_11075 [Syntrophomonadaceae bacterium]|nr:hypothetical protein [Syntrophomonadaceae bacterium]